jgi:phosphohistidine phosphatase
MKKILIMRHAKSDWADSSLADIERPLNERGRREAPVMGEELKKLGLMPDMIISSPAVRARQTAQLVVQYLGFEGDIIFSDYLYFGKLISVIDVLKDLPEKCNTVLIFGHNPTWEELVHKLSGKPHEMSTAAVAVLNFDKKWHELSGSSCKFEKILSPKNI